MNSLGTTIESQTWYVFCFECSNLIFQSFSPNGKWIVSSSLDLTIRTWDIPSSNCIDIFQTEYVATSIAFSPNAEFLVTSHVHHVGLFLWSNRSLYETISYKRVSEENVKKVAIPTVKSDDIDIEDIEKEQTEETDAMDVDEDVWDAIPVQEHMLSLSSLPKSKWFTLLNIDAIKVFSSSFAFNCLLLGTQQGQDDRDAT